MRLMAAITIGLGLLLAGCGVGDGPTTRDNANPSSSQPSGPGNGDGGAAPADSNGTDESRPAADDDPRSGPVLPPLPGSGPSDQQGAAVPPAIGGGQVHVLNWVETLDLVKRHKGKVVVVDLWSHNCPPCLRELPNFAALSKKYPEQVTCIGFNMDYSGLKKEPPESFRDDVAATVGKYEAGIVNVVSSIADQELSDLIGLSSVPAAYVFDQQGNQVQRFDNDNSEVEFTYAQDVVPLVERLLSGGDRE